MSNLKQTSHYKKLQDDLLKAKAAQMGVNADELMIKVIDGKQVWVKKTEVYTQLEKQRTLVTPRQVPRALRGDDSLINQINEEIQRSGTLIRNYRQDHMINALESSDHQAILNTILERSHNLASQLGDIEKNIETIKSGDSTFALAEALLYDMNKAQQTGNQHAVNEMKGNHGSLLKQYEVRRKKLLPFIQSARQLRMEIQKDYWRALNMRWKLLNIGIQFHLNRLKEFEKSISAEALAELYLIKGHDCRTLLNQIHQVQNELFAQIPEKNTDTHVASSIYDKIIPRYVDLLNTMDNYQNDLVQIANENCVESSHTSASTRMVFADKNQ